MKILVPDTGALIDGRVTQLIASEKGDVTVAVPNAVVAELEHQANAGKEIGFTGLEELQKITDLGKADQINVTFEGDRPRPLEIENARFGEIDARIREVAKRLGATLITTDKVQAKVASAQGIDVQYLQPVTRDTKLLFEKYFTKDTLSVHLKEGVAPKAKVGKPGAFRFETIDDKPLTRDDLERMVVQAIEHTRRAERSYIEIDKEGATVLQLGPYRTVFTKPPFSESVEMTIVRPIAKLWLKDYDLSEALRKRLGGQAEGVVVAGPPGSGKSTFASALAEEYAKAGKIVKTLEQPRDLQVSKEITQYAPLEKSFYNTADILLLVRPDYTIYDEVRKPDDFRTFADLRMAGIGMVGVVHASKPIDAIQRFIGKIELGMIPQVIDTIVFISKGSVSKTFKLDFTVRVPSGMRDQDLARPVINVSDFETGELEYEIYKFGDETVVFPIRAKKAWAGKTGRFQRADNDDAGSPLHADTGLGGSSFGADEPILVHEGNLRRRIQKIIGRNYELELHGLNATVTVPERLARELIGRQGKTVTMLEKKTGAKIQVRTQEERGE